MADYQEVEVVEDESYTQEINLTNKRNTTAKVWEAFLLNEDIDSSPLAWWKSNDKKCFPVIVRSQGNTCVFVHIFCL